MRVPAIAVATLCAIVRHAQGFVPLQAPRAARPARFAVESEAAATEAGAASLENGRVAAFVVEVSDPSKAQAFYEALGMSEAGGGLSFGAADACAVLQLEAGEGGAEDSLLGVSFHVPKVADACAACEAAGGKVIFGAKDVEIGPSMVPDEPVETTTLATIAALEDPCGRGVALVQKRRSDGFFGVSLRVEDLEQSVEFYTSALGMQLLRKRSNLPEEASISAYLGYNAGDEEKDGGAVLELRYEYGDDALTEQKPFRAMVLTCADIGNASKGIQSALEEMGKTEDGAGRAKVVEEASGKITLLDPNGYEVRVVDMVDYMMANL